MGAAEPILRDAMRTRPVQVESVEDYLKRIMREKGLDPKQIAAKANKRGLKISEGYIGNLAYGAAANPSISIVKALAYGLGEPEEDVFRVLSGKPVEQSSRAFRESVFYAMWEAYEQLAEEDKTRVDVLLDTLRNEARRLKPPGSS